MLSVQIQKKLGRFSLDIHFQAENETLALLGASGCGKSMTLKCIAGIVKPDSGIITLGDRVLFDSSRKIDLSPQKRNVGCLFQQYALFPNMTVFQNIQSGIKDKRERKARTKEYIERLRLQGLENKRPAQLSGVVDHAI